MKFYHGTTPEAWQQIQQEGVLWGVREVSGFSPARCTYLAVDKAEAQKYGSIVLEIDYSPGDGTDNWADGCWQVRVYDPIPMSNIKIANGEKT